MVAGQRKPEGQWTGNEKKAANLDHKLKYEENLIDSIYETEKNKSLVSATPLSTVFFSTSIVQNFQDSPDDEVDTRSSHEYLNNLEEEYQARSLLANSKRFFKKGTQRFSDAKATDQTECHKCSKKGHFVRDYRSKILVPLYQSPFQPKRLSSSQHKPELRPTKDFKAKYNKVKAKLSLPSLSASASKAAMVTNQGHGMKKKCHQMIMRWWRILPAESERNTTDPPVDVTDSLATDYDSADESLVYSNPLPPLKKLDGVIINEPSSAPAKGNKSSAASKVNSAPVEYSTQEDNKLKKPITSHLMKALMLSNCQNPSVDDITIAKTKDIHLMNIFILMSLLKEDTSVQNIIPILNSSLSIPSMVTLAPQDKWSQDKHIEVVNIIGNPGVRMLTRAMAKELSAASAHECLFVDFLSKEEPKKVSEALQHPGWVDAMQDELNQFSKNKVRTLVPAPYAQGYNQQEGIDYDETFDPVARLKAIRIFLAFATLMNFIVYQMNVKSAFLNGKLKENVYVKQPLGFESSEFPNHVCKLDKALYEFKQAPKAWYETLSTYLTKYKFVRGKIDNTLFVYKTQTNVILVQIYVDDIIFWFTNIKLCKQFAKLMTQRYKISMMGVLTYFLRFQTKRSERGISINQEKYVNDLLKKYDINGSLVKTLMVPPNKFGPDLNGKVVNENQYRDNPDDKEDIRSSQEYMNDLEEEYQARALLAKSKRFFKKGKNKGLIAETHKWDEKEVSLDENEWIEVKALMALTNEEIVFVGKESASN
nr:retrovirus-related Pol polyprotein from transposon TNT 1-94 [Tanacetum cinerariifolium]